MKTTEQIILQNLIYNHEYTKRVLPYLKEEYFGTEHEKTIFRHVERFCADYNKPPTIEALYIELSKDKFITDTTSKSIDETVSVLKEQEIPGPDMDWLINTSEKFCQEKALLNGLQDSISIFEGKDRHRSTGAIPNILQDALAVTFDNSIGHDYLEDADARFEHYHKKEERVPFNLEFFNKITKGGLPRKTLNLFAAGTNAGKTSLMCHMAASNLLDGKNVLYITLEMAEEEISKRIDANLMDITLDQLMYLDKNEYMGRITKLKQKTLGKLKIKEYPTAGAHVGHFKTLLNEYKLKQNFTPDIIYVDYLGITLSIRLKPGSNTNTNTYLGHVSEELRGFAIEHNLPVVSGLQLNRGGLASSDPDMTDTADSISVNFTADFVAALIATEELIEKGQIMVKQLKSRYDDKNRIPKFFIGFDRAKMKFYDVEDSSSVGSQSNQPVMDNTTFGQRDNSFGSQQFKKFKFN